jgi:hypothetical protein
MAVMQASESTINFVKTRLASPDGNLWLKRSGMVLIKPTSIANSGGSASIGENGQVTFSSITSLSLNGIFSSSFDNYMLSSRMTGTSAFYARYRLRASGTDNSTASSYRYELMIANGSTPGAETSTMDQGTLGYFTGTQRGGFNATFYGPYLPQTTAARSTVVSDLSSALLLDYASTHNQSNSYDGLTISGGTMTGAIQVYGLRS